MDCERITSVVYLLGDDNSAKSRFIADLFDLSNNISFYREMEFNLLKDPLVIVGISVINFWNLSHRIVFYNMPITEHCLARGEPLIMKLRSNLPNPDLVIHCINGSKTCLDQGDKNNLLFMIKVFGECVLKNTLVVGIHENPSTLVSRTIVSQNMGAIISSAKNYLSADVVDKQYTDSIVFVSNFLESNIGKNYVRECVKRAIDPVCRRRFFHKE